LKHSRAFTFIISLLLSGGGFMANAVELTFSQQGTNIVLNWPTNDATVGVQFTSNLSSSNWTTVHNAVLANGQYAVTQSATNSSRFYRLISPCGVNADPVVSMRVLTNGVLVANPSDPIIIKMTQTNILDASDSYDPAACASGTLIFKWITRSTDKPDGYWDQGMTGYLQPALRIGKNALIAQQAGTSFELTVTSTLTGLQTILTIPVSVQLGTLGLQMFDTCQGQSSACSTCPCIIAAALPTSEPYEQ
jgi:hypothetical protein